MKRGKGPDCYSEAAPADVEKAYRRGVHQALAMLEHFCKEEGLSLADVLPLAVKRASAIRGSSKDAPALLHAMFQKIKAEIKPAK